MAQYRWSYTSLQGKRYIVGLFHGPKTGHLMIYVNSKIVQIDFKVFEEKVYSFFLEEDLCEITIKKDNGSYGYDFQINKEVDTPLNRKRKAFNKVNRNRIITMFVGLGVFLAVIITFGISQKRKKEREKERYLQEMLAKKTVSATATIDSVKWSGDQASFYFKFYEGDIQRARIELIDKAAVDLYTQGLPVLKGDEFMMTYYTYNDSTSLKLNEPTNLQLANFMYRAFEQEQKSQSHLSEEELRCRVKCAFRVSGISGLADVYFQAETRESNPWHNRLTYNKLVRDIPFQEAFNEYCLPQ
ncbi:MAG: hypothetical protein DWQ02_14965 [Bacteroidetes bacterium]|nr:MAG: hypothetical protein DWQ02_14965 [Bacteroidota bacterium]